MKVAMIGTRGVPARYGGFETAIEEIGQRLAAEDVEVLVYCRGAVEPVREHLGMHLVHLPAVSVKVLETLSHTFLSVLHLVFRRRDIDVAIVFNAANSMFLPLLRLARIPVAVHVDGLEWQRAKWGRWGRRYYRASEALAVRWADALISDAQGIVDYYADEFGAASEHIAYGAPILDAPGVEKITPLGLTPRGFHLVVARFEPENHVLEIVRGYAASSAALPLVVVGSAPYSDEYTAQIGAIANKEPRITLLGGIWDQEQLDQLYAHCANYLHGHSVGGTNPSLLRAMGAGAHVTAFDVSFNRGVLGESGHFFTNEDDLAVLIAHIENELRCDPGAHEKRSANLQERAAVHYVWDDVADEYAALAHRLQQRELTRPGHSGRRRR